MRVVIFEVYEKPIFCNKKHLKFEDFRCFVELLGGFEPPTSSLPRMRSTD